MIPFLILGLLQEQAGSYGYELLAFMHDRHFEYVIHFTKGSFYYHLQQLETQGLIAQLPTPVGTKETRYRITTAGTASFRRRFVEIGGTNDLTTTSFYAALLFADQAPDLMPTILDQQITATQHKLALTTQALHDQPALPNHFSEILANTLERHRLNLTWYQQLQQTYHIR